MAARRHLRLRLDAALRAEGFARIIGIDEAGRGPLAGPVVAAAAILGSAVRLKGLDDSKKMSEPAREALGHKLRALRGRRVDFGVGAVSAAEIDRIGISAANALAMRRAFAELLRTRDIDREGCLVVIDGRHTVAGLGDWAQRAVVRGDGRSRSIAAASVLAKTTRDAELRELALRFPGYGFEVHKGYGTAAHLRAIAELGPCPEHRHSFAPIRHDDAKPIQRDLLEGRER